jgi:hypothetical protein
LARQPDANVSELCRPFARSVARLATSVWDETAETIHGARRWLDDMAELKGTGNPLIMVAAAFALVALFLGTLAFIARYAAS